jgi:hypothetical protein
MPNQFAKGPLARFAEAHPYQCVNIVDNFAGATVNRLVRYEGGFITGDAIATYSRLRDARRALKTLGYVQEGTAWRLIPKQAQPLPLIAEEVSSKCL